MERESKTDERSEDCDMYDDVEYVDNVRPSELDDSDSDENIRLVGVATSDAEEIDAGNGGTGVSGCSGDAGPTVSSGETDAGIVLIAPIEEAEPLGRKIDVSIEVSKLSFSSIDCTDGEGARIDESYETSDTILHARGVDGASEDDD